MAATAAQVARLRRLVNEPDDTTYDDDTLEDYIERYPCIDERGQEPYSWDTSTEPPTKEENDAWIDTYDLHAAAADVWEEKASTVAANFSFSADGAQHQTQQVYDHYMAQARYHRARRTAKTARLFKWPDESTNRTYPSWIGNRAEQD